MTELNLTIQTIHYQNLNQIVNTIVEPSSPRSNSNSITYNCPPAPKKVNSSRSILDHRFNPDVIKRLF